MYNLSKMSPNARAFIQSNLANGTTQTSEYCFAIAYAIGRTLPLPAQEADPLSYYRQSHGASVNKVLSYLNEVAPFNVRQTAQYIEKIYGYRVFSAFPKAIPLALIKETAIEDFFGLSQWYEGDILTMIKAKSDKITVLIGKFTEVLTEVTVAMANQAEITTLEDSEGGSYVI